MSRLIDRLRLVDAEARSMPPEALTDAGRAASVAVALDEAMAKLKRARHFEEVQGPSCPATFGPVAGRCNCGADAHNAALDRLRAMLDEVTA